MDAKREVVHRSLLTTQIEDTNLGVGNTTVEPGLRVRLEETCYVSNAVCSLCYRDRMKKIHKPTSPSSCLYRIQNSPHLFPWIFFNEKELERLASSEESKPEMHSLPSSNPILITFFVQRFVSPIAFSQPKKDHENPQIDKKFHKRSTHLVLAVAVASRGTTSHFDGLENGLVLGVVEKKWCRRSEKKGSQALSALISKQKPLTSGKTLSPNGSANQSAQPSGDAFSDWRDL